MQFNGNDPRTLFSGRRGKRLGWAILALAAPTLVLAQTLFGSALLTEYEPPQDAYWKIEENTMKYPQELAQEQITGCLVARVDVSKSGKTKLRGIEKSFPASGLERPFKRYINRIRWVPVDEDQPGVKESRLIRIDFCMSYESTMAARAQCVQSVQTACE